MIDRPALPAAGRLLGVCAEASAATGIPALAVRLLALVALLCAFKLTAVAYCLAALLIRQGRR